MAASWAPTRVFICSLAHFPNAADPPASFIRQTMIPRRDGQSIRRIERSSVFLLFIKLFCRLFNGHTSSRYFFENPFGLMF